VNASSSVGPFMASAPVDFVALEKAHPEINFASVENGAGAPVFSRGGTKLSDHEVFVGCVGFVADSKAALETIGAARDTWRARFGVDAPPVVDISGIAAPTDRKVAMLAFVADACAKDRVAQAARLLSSQREVLQIRAAYEEVLTSFRSLELFLGQSAKATRWIGTVIEPLDSRAPLRVKEGDVVKQLLPTDSSGMSDVGFYLISAPPRGKGELRVSLSLLETGQRVASWQIPGERLRTGWNRFALEAGLGVEARTPLLQFDWDGEETLRFGLSMRHPEERFCVSVNGTPGVAVLAVQAWKSIPGARTPVTPDAFLSGGATPRRWTFSEQVLKNVVDLAPVPDHVKFVPEHAAVMVHPVKDRVSVAVLPSAACEGMRHITADATITHPASADVEYALAIGDPDDRPRGPGEMPDFTDANHSGWVRVKAMRTTQVHLVLQTPLDGSADVYFMTRLADKDANTSNAWATFSNLRATI
jgi:hypothetical protein